MLTGSNFKMVFGFTIIKIIADVTLINYGGVRVEHFVDFIFQSK